MMSFMRVNEGLEIGWRSWRASWKDLMNHAGRTSMCFASQFVHCYEIPGQGDCCCGGHVLVLLRSMDCKAVYMVVGMLPASHS